MSDFETARNLLRQFKGDTYLHGLGVLPRVGQPAAKLGRRAVLVRDLFPGSDAFIKVIEESLAKAGRIVCRSRTKPRAPKRRRKPLFLPFCVLPGLTSKAAAPYKPRAPYRQEMLP